MSVKGVSLVYLDAGEESELIEAAQSGNQESYLRLVRQYQRPMYRAAFSMTRDAARAETLTRDVFVRAWQRIHDFPRGQRFFPWLLRAARGLFPTPQAPAQGAAGVNMDGAFDTAMTDAEGSGTGVPAGTPAEAPIGTGTAVQTGTDGTGADAGWAGAGVPSVSSEAAALAAFSELRPDEQMALSMRLLEKITYEEIAAILDLTLGVVTLRMSQARGHLLPRAGSLPQESA